MAAPITWFDLTSADPERLGAFYRGLFGWTTGPSGSDGYSLVDTGAGDGAVAGGIATAHGGMDAGTTTIYVRVEDLEAHLDKAVSLGGVIVVPPTVLPGDYGSFALFADPDGRVVGLMGQPKAVASTQ